MLSIKGHQDASKTYNGYILFDKSYYSSKKLGLQMMWRADSRYCKFCTELLLLLENIYLGASFRLNVSDLCTHKSLFLFLLNITKKGWSFPKNFTKYQGRIKAMMNTNIIKNKIYTYICLSYIFSEVYPGMEGPTCSLSEWGTGGYKHTKKEKASQRKDTSYMLFFFN